MSRAVAEALALLAGSDLEDRCRGVSRLADLEDDEATVALARLLGEPSWYLRDRVVEALGGRPGSVPAIVQMIHEGSWYARASACDALGRLGDPEAVPHLLEQLEDRNVSVQKSAVEALGRVAARRGDEPVARGIAALPPERRRRVTARIGHQSPAWAEGLREALGKLPADEFERAPEPAPIGPPSSGRDADSIVRFRRFLAALPVVGEEA